MDFGSQKSSFESRHHVKVLKIHIQVHSGLLLPIYSIRVLRVNLKR